MPGKCKFLNKWLEQPQYHAWLRNSPDIHKAHCKCCNKSFDISSPFFLMPKTVLTPPFRSFHTWQKKRYKNTFHMTLEGRFSHGGNVKTFVAAFALIPVK
jgi:hypothetical protein